MGEMLPPEEPVDARDEAATPRTLVEIMRRQRERDRRVFQLATAVAIAAFVYALAATFVAWGQHAGWRVTASRPAANRSATAPAEPSSPNRGTSESSGATESGPPSPSTPTESTSPPSEATGPPSIELPTLSSQTPSTPSESSNDTSSEPSPPPAVRPPASRVPAPAQPAPPSTTVAPPSTSTARSSPSERSGPALLSRASALPAENASPPTDRPVTLAPRPEREAEPSPGPTAAALAFGDVNVSVGSARDERGELRDYIVTLKDSQGAAFTGADVRLQGRMADRRLVEVVLDSAAQPGQYRAVVRVSPESPADLRLRITIHGATVVVPINAPTPSGS
jgi:hypothetical protein